MEHTKGEWIVIANLDGDKTIIRTGSGFVAVTKVARDVEECEANAQLIAAAPDMYEALKKAMLYLDWATTANFQRGGDNPVRAKIRKALAKAEVK